MEIIQKTILDDQEYLRQISKAVIFPDSELIDDINKLREFCKGKEAFALAAVQIGIPKRIMYFKNTNLEILISDINYDENKILINPTILERKGHTKFWEACASCLTSTGLVVRPYSVKVRYFDQFGIEKIEIIEGLPATVFSHEFDHFNGILHIDIAEKVLYLSRDERFALREKEPYQIIDKDEKYISPKVKIIK